MARKLSRFQRLRADAEAFLDASKLPAESQLSKGRKFAHFCVLVWRSFAQNRCPARASALAYGTLLALIPMLAVVMSITSTFLKKEGEDRIDQFIIKFVSSVVPPAALSTNMSSGSFTGTPENAPPANSTNSPSLAATSSLGEPGPRNPEALPSFAQDPQAVKVRKDAAHAIHNFIQNTQSGTLGVTGSVLLIFAAISMLSRIEDTFNDIWGVARGRSWFMRIVLYWAFISLAPILLVVAFGLATGPHLESTKRVVATLPVVGSFLLTFGFQVLPILVLCLTFGALYMLIPNTKVEWRAALVGGLAGGILFHLNNLANVLFVSRVVTNSKIYGSLALVPVFMIGLYFAWLILLFGAQVAYAYQNRTTYLEEKQVENVNQRGREFVALRLLTFVGQCFVRGEPPPSIPTLSEALGVPSRLVQQVMQTLGAARLVVETSGPELGFVPARPLETITCHDVLLAMRASQGQELATRDEPARLDLYGEYQRIQEAERRAAASVSLLDLAHRSHPPLLEPSQSQAPTPS